MSEPFDRHYVAVDGPEFVATFGSFPTELTLPGGATVPAGAVTQVTCRATHRRQGILTGSWTATSPRSRERGEVADVLIAAEYPIYGRFGYGPAARGTIRGSSTPARRPGSRPPARARSAFVDNADVPQGGAGGVRPGARARGRA